MPISEPAVMLTNHALTLLCAFFGFCLYFRSPNRKMSLWIAAFFVIAFAALAGGTAHGFRGPLGENWGVAWRITVLSITVGSALLIIAGIRSAMHPKMPDRNARRIGYCWLKRAVEISLIGLAVLILKLSPHPLFNHNILYHAIQMGGLYCLYRGAILLGGLSNSNRDQKAQIQEAVRRCSGRLHILGFVDNRNFGQTHHATSWSQMLPSLKPIWSFGTVTSSKPRENPA
jgi:hypothetical protein